MGDSDDLRSAAGHMHWVADQQEQPGIAALQHDTARRVETIAETVDDDRVLAGILRRWFQEDTIDTAYGLPGPYWCDGNGTLCLDGTIAISDEEQAAILRAMEHPA